MEIYLKLLEVLFPVFFVVGIGYYLGKKNPKIDTTFITTFAANIGSPAMIIYSLNAEFITFEVFTNYFWYYLVAISCFFIIGVSLLYLLKVKDKMLEEKNNHIRDNHISFEEGPHIYTIDGDSDFTSVTTWVHSHFHHFDADGIIKKMRASKNWPNNKYYPMEPTEIKKMWSEHEEKVVDHGHRLFGLVCLGHWLDGVKKIKK